MIPSVTLQGWPAEFVHHEPNVRNYNSGLAITAAGFHLATRRFNRDTWRCDLVINRLVKTENGEPAAEWVKTLDLPRRHMENFEDGRLFYHRGRLHLAYTEGHYWQRPWRAIQKLAVLRDDWSVERVITIAYGKNEIGQEKNWQFFSVGGQLFFVYSIDPHVVVALDNDYAIAETYVTRRPWWRRRLDRRELRGGTPPIVVGAGKHARFVTFPHWHVPHPERSRRYGFCALEFDVRPPFRVLRVSRPLVMASEADPSLPNPAYPHWNPLCIFPSGALFFNNEFLVSAGVNDSFDCLFHIPHDGLFQ